jgi:hypothetical protein
MLLPAKCETGVLQYLSLPEQDLSCRLQRKRKCHCSSCAVLQVEKVWLVAGLQPLLSRTVDPYIGRT